MATLSLQKCNNRVLFVSRLRREKSSHAQLQHGAAISEPRHRRHGCLSHKRVEGQGFFARMLAIVLKFSNAIVFL